MKQPRAYLVVPADRSDRFAKAIAGGTDTAIVEASQASQAAAVAVDGRMGYAPVFARACRLPAAGWQT
jgi:hypothetical protein